MFLKSKIFKAVLILFILPFLNGCFTCQTVDAAKKPRLLPDQVFNVEKCVIFKDRQLLIQLDGCLTNSSQRSQFTINIPLEPSGTNFEIRTLYSNNQSFAILNVKRDVIYSGWLPLNSLNDNMEIVPVGAPIPTPLEIEGPYDYAYLYGENARLLPYTTKTLYPVIERRETHRNDWPAQLEFIYVDASSQQKYVIIRVDKVFIPRNGHKGYYFLLPLTIPLDIATSPFQAIGFGFGYLTLAGGVTK